jgi:hypothetical protein
MIKGFVFGIVRSVSSHPALSLNVLLPLIGVLVPVQFTETAGLHDYMDCCDGGGSGGEYLTALLNSCRNAKPTMSG